MSGDIQRSIEKLQLAAVNPDEWVAALKTISDFAGGVGAVLVSTDQRQRSTPVTPSISEMINEYYTAGWSLNDIRFRGLSTAIRRGVVVDQDFVTEREMSRSPYYNDWLRKYDCAFFAGVGIMLDEHFWCLSIQRDVSQGCFEMEEVEGLLRLCRPFHDAAALARLFGENRVVGMSDALQMANQPAIVIDAWQNVVSINALAERLVGECFDVVSRKMRFFDTISSKAFDKLTARSSISGSNSKAITSIRTKNGKYITLRAVSLLGWASYTFTHASMIILIDIPDSSNGNDSGQELKAQYGLTAAEWRLAEALRAGRSLAAAADEFGIAYETARSHLKSVFLKTNTNRQGELIALLHGGVQ